IDVLEQCIIRSDSCVRYVTLRYAWGAGEVFRAIKRNRMQLGGPESPRRMQSGNHNPR
ncbi:hypothetical protein K469DRAFT_592331, partial [Zopfia rhizophila CBS 207.26]